MAPTPGLLGGPAPFPVGAPGSRLTQRKTKGPISGRQHSLPLESVKEHPVVVRSVECLATTLVDGEPRSRPEDQCVG